MFIYLKHDVLAGLHYTNHNLVALFDRRISLLMSFWKCVLSRYKVVPVMMVVLHVSIWMVPFFSLEYPYSFRNIGVHLSQCSEHNELCSKHGALVVLQSLKLDM